MLKILVNGEPASVIPATDRGLLYGDGVFETIAVEQGRPRFWNLHLARMRAGCERLGIQPPASVQLEEEAENTVNGVDRCVLKLIVTRGHGGRGYAVPASASTTRILQVHPWPEYPHECREEGVRTRMCTTRLGRNPSLAGIKHLNRLEQVLARQEWNDANIREGLLMDSDNNVVEGTMSNVFLVTDGVLMTPDLACSGVAGIMRTIIIEQARQLGLDCRVAAVSPEMLARADEVFLCNSLIGIWPVRSIDDNTFAAGNLTRQLQASVDESCETVRQWLA